MADQIVRDYWLNYQLADKNAEIWVRTSESGWIKIADVPPSEAVFLSDMLRNEKPVYWATSGALHTREEPPGEEET